MMPAPYTKRWKDRKARREGTQVDMTLYVGNLLALALLWLIVALSYLTFWKAVTVLPAPDPTEEELFDDDDPDEQFWLVPTAGAERLTPAEGRPVGRGLLLGRGKSCDLRIDDPFVSDKHLRVSAGRRACLVEDLDTANGYLVEGLPTKGESVLKEGQWFSVGETTIRVERRRN